MEIISSNSKRKEPLVVRNWQDLIKPKVLEIEEETLTETYGKFVCEPLERGFGLTIGNSMRRVLLSSLRGAAITSIRIDRALHEFSTVAGVVEDVTDIILNLKEVLIRMNEAGPRLIRISAQEEGIFSAGDIKVPPGIEILNPDLKIATLSGDGSLDMELSVQMGRGYVSAEQMRDEELPVGTIPIDAVFSPIRKVNYAVTNARVGQRTDYDKLALEVWTDGSVGPEDAVAYAAKIMKDQLTIFINFKEVEEDEAKKDPRDDLRAIYDNLSRPVDELELSVRSANCLEHANVRYIGQLVQKTETDMLRTKNFGRKSLKEIKETLSGMGLELGMKFHDWKDPHTLAEEEQKKRS